ncbi:MAG: beta-ketoacyl-[acyl-carrier-protein] synthase II, partial [Treponema sp.]|nr:beta-ketoacyl-[acyl-carrier-protein] synthase II [Treponema sp.]
MSQRRVVITGMGAVTPIGHSVEETWKSVMAGECGIDKITLFDTTDYAVKIAAEVKNFDMTNWGVDKKEARKMSRFTQFAVAAATEAIKDAGYTKETISAEKSGIMLGNGIGGFETMEAGYKRYFEAGNTRIPPLSVPLFITNEGAANISMRFGIEGLSWTLATACASGTDALGAALDLVRSG